MITILCFFIMLCFKIEGDLIPLGLFVTLLTFTLDIFIIQSIFGFIKYNEDLK